ncbi:MAG: hypothetical protein E7360_06645 [Clostridiales bacterium]|nr:hypothetical protein [Clostridiales bacterium]
MNKKRNDVEFSLDTQTKKALLEINCGDRVRFKADTYESKIYHNEVFTVGSKDPLVKLSSYGTHISVYLQNLGWFPIKSLETITKPLLPTIEQVHKGWTCCYENGPIPDCTACPYFDLSFTECKKLLTAHAVKFSKIAEQREANQQ